LPGLFPPGEKAWQNRCPVSALRAGFVPERDGSPFPLRRLQRGGRRFPFGAAFSPEERGVALPSPFGYRTRTSFGGLVGESQAKPRLVASRPSTTLTFWWLDCGVSTGGPKHPRAFASLGRFGRGPREQAPRVASRPSTRVAASPTPRGFEVLGRGGSEYPSHDCHVRATATPCVPSAFFPRRSISFLRSRRWSCTGPIGVACPRLFSPVDRPL
jgi:hypothetical protein